MLLYNILNEHASQILPHKHTQDMTQHIITLHHRQFNGVTSYNATHNHKEIATIDTSMHINQP